MNMTVAQDCVEVNCYTLEGEKVFITRYGDGDTVVLESIGMKISIKDIYADIAGKIFND